jgi:predicted DNA-binding protein (MmcQ/YjbR family)
MNLDRLRRYCLSLPHATEQVQWGNDLVFKVGGKMFAVSCLDPANPVKVSFKCDPERFAELIERPGIIPAPYLARSHWVALETFDALGNRELEWALAEAHRLVVERLPKKVQPQLATPAPKPARRRVAGGEGGRTTRGSRR